LTRAAVAVVCLAAVLSGCGPRTGGTNVAAFVRQASTPEGQAILRSIAIYRTSHNLRRACSLVTPHFLRVRYQNLEQECEVFSSEAPRTLPSSARVVEVRDGRARVRIHELSATRSFYRMALQGGTWKIDDIVPAP
jgi:hypothetical protein